VTREARLRFGGEKGRGGVFFFVGWVWGFAGSGATGGLFVVFYRKKIGRYRNWWHRGSCKGF